MFKSFNKIFSDLAPPHYPSILSEMMIIPVGMDLELPVYVIHYVSNNTNIIIFISHFGYILLTV